MIHPNSYISHDRQNDKQRLREWLSQKRYVRTSEIIRWGSLGGYSNRADRNARQLREEGFLRRLTREETKAIFGDTKELGYEIVKQFKEEPAGQLSLV